MNRWLERYRAGECRQVWTVLTSLGADLRSDAEAFAAATEVARETMGRARRNVERLIDQLPRFGFEFETETPLVPPPPDVSAQLDRLEAEIGVLPLSLRIWFEEVGQVNLNGRHPEWSVDYPDPLVVEAPLDYIRSEYEEWELVRGTKWDRGEFAMPLAPDYFHKANVSGGMPYSVRVPDHAVDGLLLWEPHQTTFVNYLRIAFSMAGIPGWEGEPAPPRWLLDLAADLLPV